MKPIKLALFGIAMLMLGWAVVDWYQRGAYEPLGHWAQGWVNQWRVVK